MSLTSLIPNLLDDQLDPKVASTMPSLGALPALTTEIPQLTQTIPLKPAAAAPTSLAPLSSFADAPTPDVSGMAGDIPPLPSSMGAPLSPLVTNGSPRGLQEQHLEDIIAKHDAPDPTKPGFWHGLAHIAAKVGNIAGDVFAPGTMALIPGTDLNNRLQYAGAVHQLAGLQAQDTQEQNAASQRSLQGAQAAHENAETQQLENPNDWAVLPATSQGLFIRNTKTGELRPLSFNGQPLTPYEKPLQTEDMQLLGDQATALQKGLQDRWNVLHPGQALPTNYALNPAMTIGAYKRLDALLAAEENAASQHENHQDQMANAAATRAVAQSNKDATQDFQMGEAGRKRLDKAEDDYRTAQQGADDMHSMVAQARSGNKMSAQMLPLEGALQITTSQGVKRINRTEVAQYEGAGNAFDRVHGFFGKWTAGQPVPPNILSDIDKLVTAQQSASYQKYRDAYDSAVKRYKLTDETPLDAPHGYVPRGATHTGRGSDGKLHFTDAKGTDLGVVPQ